MYRHIIEKTNMINNDEWVCYTEQETSWDSLSKCLTFGAFDSPHLRISRPVYEVELSDGLHSNDLVVPRYKEKVPEVTRLLDNIHFVLDEIRIRREVDASAEVKRKLTDPTWVVSEMVAYNYYDCMTGGMPTYLAAIIRYLMETYPAIDWDTYVYPCGTPDSEKDHYTLRDFYKETQDTPDITPQLKRLPKGLLALPAGS